MHHLFKRARRASRAERFAALANTVIRDFTRPGFVFDDGKAIAGFRRCVKTENLNRDRRSGSWHVSAVVVDQRPDAAPGHTGNDDIADLQGPALHEHSADRTTAAIKLGFNNDTLGRPVRVGLEIEDFSLQVDGFKKLIEIGALQGGNWNFQRLAAHALYHDLVLQQIGAHAIGVRLRFIDLVDGDNHWHAGSFGVIEGFDRLRHDAVIGRDHQHDDVSNFGAARTHGGERLVAGGIDKGDFVASWRRHLIRADVLGDAASFSRHNVG